METITNMTQAATKAIWGTPSSQEPVSGKTGDVAKGEPYDAGNMGDPPEHVEDVSTPNEAPKQSSTTNNNNNTLPTSSEVEKSMLTTSATPSTTQNQSSTSDNTTSNNSFNKPENKKDIPSANPAETKPSSTIPGDATLHQNDVRSPSDPSANPESDHVQAKENVDDTTGFDKGDNPVKLEGPGPRPVAEVAKENGGDAGKASRDGLSNSSSSSSASSSENNLTKKETEEEAEEEDPKAVPGKGLLYVKSSGLKADGGDFDATKPGAGREADRLLEEKGVHRDANSGGITGDLPESGSSKEKRSLKEKIKAKLHKVGPA